MTSYKRTPLPALTSSEGQRLLDYLPPLYETSAIAQAILQVEGSELDSVLSAIQSVLEQFYVSTASWGLDDWESDLSLPPNASLTDAERQSRIISRLKGYGTCKILTVQAVAESYVNGTVTVTENIAGYTVTVTFTSPLGIPTNLSDVEAAVRAVLPAHLALAWAFTYTLWNDVKNSGDSWTTLAGLGVTWAQLPTHKF